MGNGASIPRPRAPGSTSNPLQRFGADGVPCQLNPPISSDDEDESPVPVVPNDLPPPITFYTLQQPPLRRGVARGWSSDGTEDGPGPVPMLKWTTHKFNNKGCCEF